MPKRIVWTKNPNSRKWKLLESTFPYLENEFTAIDIKHTLMDKWDVLGKSSSKKRPNQRVSFSGIEIARFLTIHPDVVSYKKEQITGKGRLKIYKLRNKNVVDRKV